MPELATIVFYVFSAVMLFSATRVVSVKNPVHAALFLVLTFFSASGLWMLLKAEFLAIALVLVYVGAVMVLFLFVVMMLDINFEELRTQFRSYLPFGLLVGLAVLIEMVLVLGLSFSKKVGGTNAVVMDGSNTKALGIELFTKYIYAVEIAGVLLLVAIVAAIALTLRDRRESRYQNPGEQVLVRRNDRLRILKIASEKPTAAETPAAVAEPAATEAKK
ncbi:MAG TPA: NADH-quinone oxidoreductase subunit J [Casimicrobium sp.]|jgi:NADH-quinone oxidoreductase subunit J|nr:NADH-quinone oxidoreductase subunit J [Casimicrobium sp.]